MIRSASAALLLCATSALVGCGDQTGDTAGGEPSSAGTASVAQPLPAASKLPTITGGDVNLPSCRATWRPGRTLPQHYDGCMDDAMEMEVAARGHECADGSRLVSFRGRQWAVTGGPISITDGDKLLEDQGYVAAFQTCQPA